MYTSHPQAGSYQPWQMPLPPSPVISYIGKFRIFRGINQFVLVVITWVKSFSGVGIQKGVEVAWEQNRMMPQNLSSKDIAYEEKKICTIIMKMYPCVNQFFFFNLEMWKDYFLDNSAFVFIKAHVSYCIRLFVSFLYPWYICMFNNS